VNVTRAKQLERIVLTKDVAPNRNEAHSFLRRRPDCLDL